MPSKESILADTFEAWILKALDFIVSTMITHQEWHQSSTSITTIIVEISIIVNKQTAGNLTWF